MTIDIRAALERLVELNDIFGGLDWKPWPAAIAAARDALAAEPELPAKCVEAERTDSDLLQFLLDNFRSHSLHMDGTAYYSLDRGWPFNHRSSNSRAFVEQAYHKFCEHLRKQS